MSRVFKTKSGSELPIMNLRGKDYLEVKYRALWFREERPLWGIETEIVSVTDNSACVKAIVRDETGKIIASSHKFEDVKGFGDFIEKAETGAVGRALALCGYGTQFCADELEEGSRVVDSPVSTQYSPAQKSKGPTEKQLARMFALSREASWSPDDVKLVMTTAFGVATSKELSKTQYDAICGAMEQKQKAAEAAEKLMGVK